MVKLLLLIPLTLLLNASNSVPLHFRNGHDHALFFVINDYDDSNFDDLKNPIPNARAIASVLNSKYGFDTTIIENPTKELIALKIREFQDNFSKNQGGKFPEDGQLIIFFSGHGVYENKKGYFLPSDSKANFAFGNGISYGDLRPEINAINCKHTLVIVDACHSATYNQRFETRDDPGFRRPGEFSDEQKMLDYFKKYKTRIFFTSDAKNKETPDNSPFSQRLLLGLNMNSKPYFTASELFANHLDKVFPKAKAGAFEEDEDGAFIFFLDQKLIDSDGDKIPDIQDTCPYEYGIANNNGCPTGQVIQAWSPVSQKPIVIPPGMVFVKGGQFTMGDVMKDLASSDETLHPVVVSDFFLAKYELTFDEYDDYCVKTKKPLPSDAGWGRGSRPVININWYDAIEYCNWKSRQEGLPPYYNIDKTKKDPNNHNLKDASRFLVTINPNSQGYRLPTEAEWEFAARERGQNLRFGNGTSIADSKEINFNASPGLKKDYSLAGEYRNRTMPVGSFSPNKIKLYDMCGNVREWCYDWYDKKYPNTLTTDPIGAAQGINRCCRGGSWGREPLLLRASYRDNANPVDRIYALGLRVARSKI